MGKQAGGQRAQLCDHHSAQQVYLLKALRNNLLPIVLIKKSQGSVPSPQPTPELKMVHFVYSHFLPGQLLTEPPQPNPMARPDPLTPV